MHLATSVKPSAARHWLLTDDLLDDFLAHLGVGFGVGKIASNRPAAEDQDAVCDLDDFGHI